MPTFACATLQDLLIPLGFLLGLGVVLLGLGAVMMFVIIKVIRSGGSK
jgi:hypothetical protein